MHAIEEAEKDEQLDFDKEILHKLAQLLEECLRSNLEQRAQFAKQPEKFQQSEVIF